MGTAFVETAILVVGIYGGMGFILGIPFCLKGAGRIDPAARDTSLFFKLLLLPGMIIFWPFLYYRWISGKATPPEEANCHRRHCR